MLVDIDFLAYKTNGVFNFPPQNKRKLETIDSKYVFFGPVKPDSVSKSGIRSADEQVQKMQDIYKKSRNGS